MRTLNLCSSSWVFYTRRCSDAGRNRENSDGTKNLLESRAGTDSSLDGRWNLGANLDRLPSLRPRREFLNNRFIFRINSVFFNIRDSVRILNICQWNKNRKKSTIFDMLRTLILHNNNAEELFKKMRKKEKYSIFSLWKLFSLQNNWVWWKWINLKKKLFWLRNNWV